MIDFLGQRSGICERSEKTTGDREMESGSSIEQTDLPSKLATVDEDLVKKHGSSIFQGWFGGVEKRKIRWLRSK